MEVQQDRHGCNWNQPEIYGDGTWWNQKKMGYHNLIHGDVTIVEFGDIFSLMWGIRNPFLFPALSCSSLARYQGENPPPCFMMIYCFFHESKSSSHHYYHIIPAVLSYRGFLKSKKSDSLTRIETYWSPNPWFGLNPLDRIQTFGASKHPKNDGIAEAGLLSKILAGSGACTGLALAGGMWGGFPRSMGCGKTIHQTWAL